MAVHLRQLTSVVAMLMLSRSAELSVELRSTLSVNLDVVDLVMATGVGVGASSGSSDSLSSSRDG